MRINIKEHKLKTFLVVALILLILFCVISVIVYRYSLGLADKLPSVEEIIKFHNSEFIKMEKSSQEGYKYDVYAKLSLPPVTEDGFTQEIFYDDVTADLCAKILDNYRLIDEEKQITVEVTYDFNNSSGSYTINGVYNYFQVKQAEIQQARYNNTKINININAPELQSLINVDWIRRSANLGTVENNFNNYDYYFDEGYKTRSLGTKVFNIVFTPKYTGTVVNGLRTGLTATEIRSRLGEPIYAGYNDNTLIYKSDTLYVCFSMGDISVYPIEKFDVNKNTQFANLFEQLCLDGDATKFYNSLISLYPNPEISSESETEIVVAYPTLGFVINFGGTRNGLTLYNNYQGMITNNISMDDLKNGNIPPNVYLELDTDSIIASESNRAAYDKNYREGDTPVTRGPVRFLFKTNKYSVFKNGDSEYNFYSIDKLNYDSSITLNSTNQIFEATDTSIVYGVKDKGIYMYNMDTLQTVQLIEGQGDFIINKVEDNTIYYDDTHTYKIGL